MVHRALTTKAQPDGLPDGQTAANSELFAAGGPKDVDVSQGGLGDCYVMASLAALAKTDPAILEHRIKPVPGQAETYYVMMFQKTSKNTFIPIYERVCLGQGAAKAYLDPTTGKNIVWPQLFEQAFAKLKETSATDASGYVKEGLGGWPWDPLSAITGCHAETEGDPLKYESTIAAYTKPGSVLTANSQNYNTEMGTVGPHIYTVEGMAGAGPNAVVTVRNPWGTWGPIPTNLAVNINQATGIATMPLYLFEKTYNVLIGAHTDPAVASQIMPPTGKASTTPGGLLIT